jgi:diguanylate cyclase (GGDEF)-like protein
LTEIPSEPSFNFLMNNGIRIKKNLLLLSILLSQIVGLSLLLVFFQNFEFHFPLLLLVLFSASFFIFFRLELGLIIYILETLFIFALLLIAKYPSPYMGYFIFFFFVLTLRSSLLKVKYQRERNSINLSLEGIEERLNLNNSQYLELVKINEALERKIFRFTHLRTFSEDIIANLNLKELLNVVSTKSLEIISKGDLATVYLFDSKKDVFNLASSHILSPKVKIKAKTGDPCEYWVFRQRTPLLITDILRDFRFDSEEVFSYGREFRSLISSPIMSRDKLLGILRIDAAVADEFTVDDLRLLDIISALAAIAIDNAYLFQKMGELAIQDGLTKFYLRREFMRLLDQRIKRDSPKYFALLMIDIDDFKNCNDNFGHIAGDLILKNISWIIKSGLKKDDIACRYGGEEFLVLLNSGDKADLIERAEIIRQSIEKSGTKVRRQNVNITVTIGMAIYPDEEKEAGSLIELSDTRLYKGKQSGKNRLVHE